MLSPAAPSAEGGSRSLRTRRYIAPRQVKIKYPAITAMTFSVMVPWREVKSVYCVIFAFSGMRNGWSRNEEDMFSEREDVPFRDWRIRAPADCVSVR